MTGRKEYKWLSIGQQDMEQLQFRCMVTELTPISHGWLPVAFQATIQCDCPYAYSYPFEKQYTISGETTILFRNESSVREYLKPEISFAPASSTRTLSLVNLNDDNREFKLTGIPSGASISSTTVTASFKSSQVVTTYTMDSISTSSAWFTETIISK